MKLTELEIHASPITNTIYAGKMNKSKNEWLTEREDVTDKVHAAVVEWFSNEIIVRKNKDANFGYYLKDGRALKVTAEIIDIKTKEE